MKKLLLFLLIPYSLLLTHAPCTAQYTILHSFNKTAGALPLGSLTRVGKTLFGMTGGGGADSNGCLFKIDTNGSGYTVLISFNGLNGARPQGSLLNSGNKLYGMTMEGGINGSGDVFSIDTDGSGYVDLHDFNWVSGGYEPQGSLILSGNTLFGTTGNSVLGYGAVFSIHTNGSNFKTLYFFQGYSNSDFEEPYGDLTLIGRTLYGMTKNGGVPYGRGGIFSMDTSGSGYRMVFSFNDTDGAEPYGSLILSGKVFYGMTWRGGLYLKGVIFAIDTDGIGIRDIYNFKGDSNGEQPYGSLTLSGSRLYGMTELGGGYEEGVIFSIDTNGSGYRRMHIFNDTDGAQPFGSLIMSGSSLYGMTRIGGSFYQYNNNGYGVIFKADTSLNDTSHVMTAAGGLASGESGWSVYPNPSNGIFTIAAVGAKNFSPAIIEVYNVFGQLVYTYKPLSTNHYSLDLSGQPNGIYFFRISDENGGNIGSGKLVIEH